MEGNELPNATLWENTTTNNRPQLNETFTKKDFLEFKRTEKNQANKNEDKSCSNHVTEDQNNKTNTIKSTDNITLQTTDEHEVVDEDLDEKTVSETNFSVVSKILNENAALCKKIEQGLEPVVVEPKSIAQTPGIHNSFEHIDIRALIFSKAPVKSNAVKDKAEDSKVEATNVEEKLSTNSDLSHGETHVDKELSKKEIKQEINESNDMESNFIVQEEKKTYVSKTVLNIIVSPRRKDDPEKLPPAPDEDLDQVSSKLVEDVIAEVEAESCSSSENLEEVASIASSDTSGELKPDPNFSAAEDDEKPPLSPNLSKSEINLVINDIKDNNAAMETSPAMPPSDDDGKIVNEAASTLIVRNQELADTSTSDLEDTLVKTSNDTLTDEARCENEQPVEPKPDENTIPLTPTNRKHSIPPAFAELLDSLRKKRVPKIPRSPPKTLAVQKNYNLSDNINMECGYSTDITQSCVEKTGKYF